MIGNFLTGAGYLLKGFGLIKRPGLRRFFFVPLLVNIAVFSLLIYLGLGQFEALVNSLLPDADGWWAQTIRFLLSILFWVLAAIILFFGFTLVANLIAAPFNGLLAERVEMHLTAQSTSDASGFVDALKDVGPAVVSELGKYLYFLLLAIPLAIIFFVPGVNLLLPFFSVIFGAWMMVLEYTAYPAENTGLKFKATRASVRRHRMMSLGFGAAILLATVIPLVNFLVMPAAVAGATALWVERLRDSQ